MGGIHLLIEIRTGRAIEKVKDMNPALVALTESVEIQIGGSSIQLTRAFCC